MLIQILHSRVKKIKTVIPEKITKKKEEKFWKVNVGMDTVMKEVIIWKKKEKKIIDDNTVSLFYHEYLPWEASSK